MTMPCPALASSTKLSVMNAAGIPPGFPERVREVLESAGVNQSQAMRKLGTAYTTVTKWVNGKGTPSIANIVPLAELGGVHIEWLITGKGPKYVDKALNAADETTERERQERYQRAVDAYLASPLADDVSPKTVTLLRDFDFATLGTTHPEVKDVHRVRDLIDTVATLRHFSGDGESGPGK